MLVFGRRRARPRLLALSAACLAALVLLAAHAAPPAGAAAAGKPQRAHRVDHRHAIVPVLAEAGGVVLGERQRGSRVRVYRLSGGGAKPRRTLVGRGRTGSHGVALVRLRTRRAPKRMLVVVAGGRLLGGRFGGHMKARIAHSGRHAVFVSPLSSLLVSYMGAHPRLSPGKARRAVLRSLRIPGFFDFAGDLANRQLFDGRSFVRRARSHGGFDRYVERRARRLGAKGARSSAAAFESCWSEAAQTTAGMAAVMGFRGVPSPPSLPACRAGAGGSVAHASGIFSLEVFGVLTGVASLIYGVASGQGTAAQLAEIQKQLNEVQAELQQIQAQLGGLQAEVADVNANVVSGDESALVADALPTIDNIKTASADTTALLGAASQILCAPGAGCSVPAGTDNLGEALDIACTPETKQCEKFYSDLYFTSRALEGLRPGKAIENLGGWALGSAASGGPGSPGIVQYALEQGAGDEQFFQTGDAKDARLQWAYYTLFSTYAQTTYATVLSMGIGQPLPNSKSSHPPRLSAAIVREQVEALDRPIGLQIAAFPNMPDTAVIDTNFEAADKEAPSMFPQQVGALATAAAFQGAKQYALSKANVSAGRISSSEAGQSLPTLQTAAEPPLVMTPAAASGETWQLLPSGGQRSRPPAVSTATFSDWGLAAGTSAGALPEWNPTTQKPEAAQEPLTGPLPNLYGAAKTSENQTAGQWLVANSGIDSALLTATGSGYGSATGLFAYYAQSGTDSKEPGLAFAACSPGGDPECLLPTWQSTSLNPFNQVTAGQTYNAGSTQLNTGLFDLNNGLVIANQQGHKQNESQGFTQSYPSNPGAFLNQYPNWTNAAELRGLPFYGFLAALNGTAQGPLTSSAFSSQGRPVLFTRQQSANDCFLWTSAGSGAPYGSGCLKPREHSTEILP